MELHNRERSSLFANCCKGHSLRGSSDSKIYALNATNGKHIWNYTTGDSVFSSPTVAAGVVYVGSIDNRVYALDAANGKHIWNYTTSGSVSSSPVVANGIVYIVLWITRFTL